MEKFAALVTIVEAHFAAADARMKRLCEAYAEENKGMTPILDSMGRLHAPCDGYELPNAYRTEYAREYDGVLFGKGEFLPIPLSNEEQFFGRKDFDPTKFMISKRVKAPVDSIRELNDQNFPLLVESGKSWEQNGLEVAYAYLKGPWKDLVEAAAAHLESELQNKVVAEPEVYMEEGRHTVTGKIAVIKPVNDPLYGPSWKMMVVTEQGHKLWGTRPSALTQEDQGHIITFTAAFSKGKNGMSYFKRPTKVMVKKD